MNDTQRYAVYHANDVLEVNLPPAMRWYADTSMYYTHVADVVAPLEQVFTITNHIDHPWTDNPEVAWLATSRIRSTSVGDVIVSSESGQVWLVMPIGLRELPPLKGMSPGNAQTTGTSDNMQHELHAPFGLSQVANYEEVSRRYISVIPYLAQEAPLPQTLPARHPLLAHLEGRYAVQDHLPPWWHGYVEALTTACPCLDPLVRPLSQVEFRYGSIDQQRWKAWRNGQCQLNEGQRAVPCWKRRGPGFHRIMAGLLPAESRQVWLDRFVDRGDKDIPLDLDLVITSDPAWWLTMGNGLGWYSYESTGPVRDPRIIGNWYDTGVLLAALVARGADCWTPDCLIARTTVRLVIDNNTGSVSTNDSSESSLRAVLGQVYHNDLTSACNLLLSLAELFEQRSLPWGCIAGTNTAQFAQDGSLGELAIEEEARKALGVPYWLPAATERPALEGQVAYLGSDELASGGSWTYPLFSVYACQLLDPIPNPIAQSNDSD
jgi:hypothetical protein